MNNADDHMRMIKACLKNALAGVNAAITRAVASTFALQMPAGTSTDPSYSFVDETTLGIYRASAGQMAIAGQLTGNGAVDVGSTHMFLVAPSGLGSGGTGTGHRYLELDGSTWANSAFPALATHLGQGGSTFTLPDMKTLGRFPRSRTAAVAAGTAQGDTVGPHTHPDVTKTTGAQSADHYHTGSGTTGADSPDHTHGFTASIGGSTTGGGAFAIGSYPSASNTSGASARHYHSYSFSTSGVSANHTHSVTVDTPANTGTTETRPVALSFVFCIKT
jgi:hypothetical protein